MAAAVRHGLFPSSSNGDAPRRGEKVAHRVLLAVAACLLLIGLALRVAPVLSAGFPVNDGGLFSVMIDAVRGDHYSLPAVVAYNGLEIPFAYPPLAFYLAAVVADGARAGAIDVLRVLPLVFNLLAMGAFYLLALAVCRSRAGAVAALAVLVMLPGSYQWLIGGGGLTRSLGLAFVFLALRQAYILARDGSNRAAVLLAVFAALAALSHLEMAWLMAYSVGLVLLGYGRTWGKAARFVAAGAGAALLVAPWALTVLARFGPGPFLAAANTGSALDPGAEDPGLLLIAAVVLLIFVALAATGEERLFLTGWIGCIVLLDSRSIWLVIFPITLAIGRVVEEFLLPLLSTLVGGLSSLRSVHWRLPVPGSLGATVAALVVAGWAFHASLPQWDDARGAVGVLSRDDRAAMAWTDASLPASSRLVVVSGGGWARDRVGEWLPVLANRVSVSTVQGTEWLPNKTFRSKLRRWLDLQQCGEKGEACLDAWLATSTDPVTHVYIARWDPDCCARLRADLRADPSYRVVYDGPSATIFERQGAP